MPRSSGWDGVGVAAWPAMTTAPAPVPLTAADLRASLADVAAAVDDRFADSLAALRDLVRIASVSAPGFDPAEVRRSAEAVRDLLAATGFAGARLLEVEGAHPAVYGERLDAGPDAPTVLLYAHHDVQPPGDAAAWTSPAFVPTERDGRLYGRGAADDKAGVVAHVAAVDAWLRARGAVPVNVKVVVEGEEETGSEHLGAFLDAYGDVLRADAAVIADSTNWKVGVPALTYALRGLVDCTVEVRALDHAVHSGMYGGPVPDPVTALCKLVAALTDDRGAVAVPALREGVPGHDAATAERIAALGFDEDGFRADAGLLDGVPLGGDPELHPLHRLWREPNLTVIGFDAPAVAGSSNPLVPSARARLSLRLAPGQDACRTRDALVAHLRAQRPLGLEVEVVPGAAGDPFLADLDDPATAAALQALEAAYGAPAALIGVGGSIPLLEPMARAFGGAAVLLTGVEDPDTRAHGIDESLHLGDFRRACTAHAFLLEALRVALTPRAAARTAAP